MARFAARLVDVDAGRGIDGTHINHGMRGE
jgi:hypothetical protein